MSTRTSWRSTRGSPPSSPAARASLGTGASVPNLGQPSRRSALIVRTQLPAGLESLRRRSVGDAAAGVPAHLTLLYPFVTPERLGSSLRAVVAAVAARHPPFDYDLVGSARWPDTIYVAVDPELPFIALQGDLAAAFPDFPIYGRDAAFKFVPHVTVAEGPAVEEQATMADQGWRALPRHSRASGLEVISADTAGRWRTAWRVRLGMPRR